MGGSSVARSAWLLYLISALLLAVLIARLNWSGSLRPDRLLLAVANGFLLLALLQLIPLPPSLWAHLPGRLHVDASYHLLGVAAPWLTLSLDPAATLGAMLATLPIGCIVLLVGRTVHIPARQVSIATVGLGLLSLVVGIAQAKGGAHPALYWQRPNDGMAGGVFSNPNHLATLLLICVPLFAALLLRWAQEHPAWNRMRFLALAGFAFLVATGIFLTRSLAGLLLLVPTLMASYALLRPTRRTTLTLGVIGCIGGLIFTITTDLKHEVTARTSLGSSELDRRGIFARSMAVATANWPVGSGIGTFREAYRAHENEGAVEWKYVNRAHNEYIDFTIEAGLPGAIIIVAFLAWWAARTISVWSESSPNDGWPKAASIVIGIVVFHSLVDYPLRMPTLYVLCTFYVLLLASYRRDQSSGFSHR